MFISSFNKQIKKKGFALTEVLLAIAVIVIIGIAAYPLYKNARTSSEVEAMANDIAILQTNAQTLYSGQSSFTTITEKQLEDAGLAPDDLKTATSGVWNNSWGGFVYLKPSPAIGGLAANAGFTITLTAIPQSACTQLVNRVAPSFLAIGIGTDGTSNDGSIKGGNATNMTKVDVTKIAAACPAAGGTLAFTAR